MILTQAYYHGIPFRLHLFLVNEKEFKGILHWDLPSKALFTLVHRNNSNFIEDIKSIDSENFTPLEKLYEIYQKSPWEIMLGQDRVKCLELSRKENGEVCFSRFPF